MGIQQPKAGYTIVELLIVIVVIGILAAITIVAYSGIQDRARMVRMNSDLRNLQSAIIQARTQTSQVLGSITQNFATAETCAGQPGGTNLATLPKTDACWVNYLSALDKISLASGRNVRNLVDPWGRPYIIDENETERGPTDCEPDYIAAFQRPLSGWTLMTGTLVSLPNTIAPEC